MLLFKNLLIFTTAGERTTDNGEYCDIQHMNDAYAATSQLSVPFIIPHLILHESRLMLVPAWVMTLSELFCKVLDSESL